MVPPIPDSDPVENKNAKSEDRVPILMEEVDSIQVCEDNDTRGDNRYPPVRRPPVFPRVFAPPAPNQPS